MSARLALFPLAPLLFLGAGLSFLLSGCADPIRQELLDELGPEAPGVEEGPLHRPGQPCLACHGEKGPSSVTFSLAGTIYRTKDSALGEAGVKVRLIDFTGLQHESVTNEAGNFYVSPDDFQPAWPVWVRIERGEREQEMISAIVRDGSCASCHQGKGDPSHVAQVQLVFEEEND